MGETGPDLLKRSAAMVGGPPPAQEVKNKEEGYCYARIVKNDELDFDEKVDFVYNFCDWTFNKEIAKDVLPTYLESNKTEDNTNYSNVNIHSSLDQVTWGNLYVKKMSEPVCTVEEMRYCISLG